MLTVKLLDGTVAEFTATGDKKIAELKREVAEKMSKALGEFKLYPSHPTEATFEQVGLTPGSVMTTVKNARPSTLERAGKRLKSGLGERSTKHPGAIAQVSANVAADGDLTRMKVAQVQKDTQEIKEILSGEGAMQPAPGQSDKVFLQQQRQLKVRIDASIREGREREAARLAEVKKVRDEATITRLAQMKKGRDEATINVSCAADPRQQAHQDYEAVAGVVEDFCKDSLHLRDVDRRRIADFLGHHVAASFQNEAHYQQMPEGYDFLPKEDGLGLQFPHPNVGMRGRTQLAEEVCAAVEEAGGDRIWQIFALILFRFHNTEDAWKRLKEPLQLSACVHEPGKLNLLPQLVERLRKLYAESALPFSQGDSRHQPNRNGEFVLKSLSKWYTAAVRADAVLAAAATTPVTWHEHFLQEMLPKLPGFGHYWAKYLYGDIGLLLTNKCDLERFTVIGPGCADLLRSWGLQLPKSASAYQQPALEILRELREVVSAVFDSRQHAGIERARKFAHLQLPTVYDLQVASCECKRGHKLISHVAKERQRLRKN